MKTLTPPIQSKLDTRLGTEPILVVGVQWQSGTEVLYSDKEINSAKYPYPKVISVGSFDTSMALTGSSDSLTTSVTLDDTDGSIKAISNGTDIHNARVKVYLTFEGVDLSQKTLLFDGEIVTPIDWTENDRSVTFTILSKLEDRVVGFAMEEGDFPDIPEEALGKAWPLAFGQVCHIPAVKVRAPRQGYLIDGLGIHDWTLHIRLCQAMKLRCPLVNSKNEYAKPISPGFTTYLTGVQQGWRRLNVSDPSDPTNDPAWEQAKEAELECRLQRHQEICKLKLQLEDQMQYESDTVDIFNGVNFPQGESITLYVDGARITGSFSGNTFTITNRVHSKYDDWEPYECQPVDRLHHDIVYVPDDQYSQMKRAAKAGTGGYNIADGVTSSATETSVRWNDNPEVQLEACDKVWVADVGHVGGTKDSWAYYNDMDGESFDWHPPGSDVFLVDEQESIHIVSLIPGTVLGVAAYKTLPNGKKLLTTVPPEYYTVYNVDYTAYTVTELHMEKDLNLLDEDFEDQIYVSFLSSEGPNVADVIEWLVNKYTDLTVDATSFSDIKTKTANYPCNFYLLERPNVYALIQDLAYQSRCGVTIRNKVMSLTYLSEEPTSVATIDNSSILHGTFKEDLTPTGDIRTHHLISYTKAGATMNGDSNEFKIDLKYNVGKYGAIDQSYNYYTQNTYSTILKSATFWLIRKANVWRRIALTVPMKYMALDVGDSITLDSAQFYADPIKCVIDQLNYNPQENTLDIECWTPIRSGEDAPYYWAWPANQPATAEWPLPGDTAGSNGYNSEMIPPVGHILSGGFNTNDHREMSLGDKNPSDLDDVLPTVICQVSDELSEYEFDDPPELRAWTLAKSNQASRHEEFASGGGGGAGGGGGSDGSESQDDPTDPKQKAKLSGACNKPACGCLWCVTETWHTSHTQGVGCALPGCPPCGGPCKCYGGCPSCTGPVWTKRYPYTSIAGAVMRMQKPNKLISSTWGCNETAKVTSGMYQVGATQCNGSPCSSVVNDAAYAEPNIDVGQFVDNEFVPDNEDPYYQNDTDAGVGGDGS